MNRCSTSLIRGAGSMSAIEIARQDLSIRSCGRRRRGRPMPSRRAHSGHRHGAGWSFAAVGRAGQRHGPADATRLSASLQRGWLGRAGGPAPAWASASSGRSPAERSGEAGGEWPRPQDRWGVARTSSDVGFGRCVSTSRRLRSCYSSEYCTPSWLIWLRDLMGIATSSRTTSIVARCDFKVSPSDRGRA